MRRSTILLLLLGATALLWPWEAHTGRVHYQQTSLERLVQSAYTVVVATGAEPATTVEQVHFRTAGRGVVPKKVEFSTTVGHFLVQEVLLNTSSVEPPERLDVAQDNVHTRLRVSVAYQVDGVHKSPIYDQYDGIDLGAVQPGQQVVLFLYPPQAEPADDEDRALQRALDGAWRLVAEGGIESHERLNEVRRLLAEDWRTEKLSLPPETGPTAP